MQLREGAGNGEGQERGNADTFKKLEVKFLSVKTCRTSGRIR